MKEKKDNIHLGRIIVSIEKIQRFVDGFDSKKFSKDEKTFDAALLQIVNIGEMISHLSSDFREKHADLPWHDATGMRNRIAHGYYEIEPEVVWKTIKSDLPKLKSKVKKILVSL